MMKHIVHATDDQGQKLTFEVDLDRSVGPDSFDLGAGWGVDSVDMIHPLSAPCRLCG